MPIIPIATEDIAAGRALRTTFAHFWSTETGEPRTVYDRFVAATPTVAGTTVVPSADDAAPGIWVRPVVSSDTGVLLFLHGGGYGLGSATAYVGFVSHLAARAGVSTFILDYPLAPEAQLPVALDLAVATLRRLRDRHPAVAVAGDSAGGGLALAALTQATDQGIEVAGAAVFSPWTDLSLSGASVSAHAIGDPLLDPAYLRQSAAAYLGDTTADDPRASPLVNASGGLPPILVQVGTDEILLDDAVRYAEAVHTAGVRWNCKCGRACTTCSSSTSSNSALRAAPLHPQASSSPPGSRRSGLRVWACGDRVGRISHHRFANFGFPMFVHTET